MTKIQILVLATIISFVPARADDGNSTSQKANQEALRKTQELLRSPGQRQEFLSKDANAQKMDSKLDSTFGGQKEELYDLSASIMEVLVKDSNGDPDKMMELLGKYQSNPKGFFDSLSPEQKQRIKQIGERMQQSSRQPGSQPK